jgi:hypothetical protein
MHFERARKIEIKGLFFDVIVLSLIIDRKKITTMKNQIQFAKDIFGRLAFTLLMLLSAISGYSQTASLNISHVNFSKDTNLTFGGTDTLSYTITNIGAPYTGPLYTHISTDNGITLADSCVLPAVTLAANAADSVHGTCTITLDSAHFHSGYNIVVVWSSGNARTAADTVKDSIYIKNPSGIHENNLSSTFKIYPSVTKDLINVETSGNIFPVKIFIEDISGRIVKVVCPSPESRNRIKINTSDLNGGIYFLDMVMPDKRRVVSKFIKAE